jgi:hypothetical protein
MPRQSLEDRNSDLTPADSKNGQRVGAAEMRLVHAFLSSSKVEGYAHSKIRRNMNTPNGPREINQIAEAFSRS